MFVIEVFLPIADANGTQFPISFFRRAFEELGDKFGQIDTSAVYRPLRGVGATVREIELYRYRFDVPSTDENQQWLVTWREEQERQFGESLWMIRYRHD